MNRKKWMEVLILFLSITGMVLMFSSCDNGMNEGDTSVSDENRFSWWIPMDDSQGTYYESYNDNVVVQWINNQYWDKETMTIGTEDNGERLWFDFQVPVAGVERDNFNTMIATGEYPEIIDLSYATQSEKQMFEDGILMDITEYVEAYLPNYLALLDTYPELKPFVSSTDENGTTRYYSIYTISDNSITPWAGYAYRRDWLVKYALPSEYIWDWESDIVSAVGHPLYTPLAAAIEANDFTGWKKNDIQSFFSEEGSDPSNDYIDNIVFPSGKKDPYTISDWEWMFEAFKVAIDEEGYSEDINAYCTSVYYLGYFQPGDLVSSFGGGGPLWYIDKSGDATFGGTSNHFKTYIQAMNSWMNKGWLDRSFETRSSELFFETNSTGVGQGKVGMWMSAQGMLGTTIRATAVNDEAKESAMVFGCSLPINDVYGSDEEKFVEPYTFYQMGNLGVPIGITTIAEEKNLETLFAMINWMYTREGGLINNFGLNEEQYNSMTFNPDLYKENSLTSAYSIIDLPEGGIGYKANVPKSMALTNAIASGRMQGHLQMMGNEEDGYSLITGNDKVIDDSINNWNTYTNTGYILDYDVLMDDEASLVYGKTNTFINDYMGLEVPKMIKNGPEDWESYVAKLNKYGAKKVTAIYQELIEASE